MKSAIIVPLLLLAGCATSGALNPPQAQQPAEEATIRSLEERNRTAVLGQDFPALEAIWSADFMVNTPGNLVSPNRSAVLNVFRQGIAHYSSYEQTIEQIRIEGDLAIVMGGEMVKPIGNAPLAGQTVQRRFTHLWKKENGQWRLTARHANNVFPPPM